MGLGLVGGLGVQVEVEGGVEGWGWPVPFSRAIVEVDSVLKQETPHESSSKPGIEAI